MAQVAPLFKAWATIESPCFQSSLRRRIALFSTPPPQQTNRPILGSRFFFHTPDLFCSGSRQCGIFARPPQMRLGAAGGRRGNESDRRPARDRPAACRHGRSRGVDAEAARAARCARGGGLRGALQHGRGPHLAPPDARRPRHYAPHVHRPRRPVRSVSHWSLAQLSHPVVSFGQLSVRHCDRLGDAHRLFDQQHARYATLYSAAIRTWNVSRQEALAVVAEAIETHKVAQFLSPTRVAPWQASATRVLHHGRQ